MLQSISVTDLPMHLLTDLLLADLTPVAGLTILAVWLFVMGGCMGSFLNVVVYRLPAGINLAWPGSHCPHCKHPIRWYDNLPVLGWIVLNGHCRDCRQPISLRYPSVEAATAVLFLALGWVEIVSGGGNLPVRPEAVVDGWITPTRTTIELAAILACHLLLLTTLLAASLIEYDGHRSNWRLWLPALAVGLLAPLGWPTLRPVPAVAALDGWLAGLVDGLAGAAAGAILGRTLLPLIGRSRGKGWMLALVGTGLVLGWQAIVALALASAAADGVARLAGRMVNVRRVVPATAWLATVTLAWVLAWRWIVDSG